jgi:hypothetical protein
MCAAVKEVSCANVGWDSLWSQFQATDRQTEVEKSVCGVRRRATAPRLRFESMSVQIAGSS